METVQLLVLEDNSCVKQQSQVLCAHSATLNTSNEAGSPGPFYRQEQGQSDPRGRAGPYKADSKRGVQLSTHNTPNCHTVVYCTLPLPKGPEVHNSSPQRSSQYTTHNQELPTKGVNAENNRSPNASFPFPYIITLILPPNTSFPVFLFLLSPT